MRQKMLCNGGDCIQRFGTAGTDPRSSRLNLYTKTSCSCASRNRFCIQKMNGRLSAERVNVYKTNSGMLKGVFVLENVFGYFLAIGAGLTMGIAIVLIPSFMVYNKFSGGRKNVRKL